MSQPSVTITELDGALGVLPPSSGKLFALVGVSSSGTQNAPATYARVKDVVAAFGAGPLVEAAAHYIERYGKPVVLVRTGQTTAGSPGTLVTSVAGTSVVTLDTTAPNDDYEGLFRVVTGGTVGTAGITFQWSLDGGRTLSPVTALGTANTYVFPGTGGVNIDFAAGTLLAGDYVTFRTTAPCWNSTELGTALDALGNSAANWELVHVVGPIDATSFDTIETKVNAMAAAGKYHGWIGNCRVPNVSESESSYLTAMNAIFASKTTTHGMLCAGACKLTSSVNGRKYKRPVAFAVAARQASVDHEVNVADVNLGTLTGVSIRDANGNADEHDESINPGLDDARFCVLRTWDGIPGVYVNRPRLFSSDTSDYQLMPHRRVMNICHEALRAYFIRRLNKAIRVNASTGFILEEEALEIEAGALAAMRSTLLAKPKASGVQFALSRTDNLLSTKTLTGQARIIPLGYPEFVSLDLGFVNPALQVQTAA